MTGPRSVPAASGGGVSSEAQELLHAFRALRAALRWIVLATLLAGALTYLYSRFQQPLYAASADLLSTVNTNNNAISNSPLSQTLVSSTALPQEALNGALASADVLDVVAARVKTLPGISDSERARVLSRLKRSVALQDALDFRLRGKLDLNGNGTYTLAALNPNSALASSLANFAADALISWDAQRALRTVSAAQRSLEGQLQDINLQLGKLGQNTPEARALLELRTDKSTQLSSVRLLKNAAFGTLSIVAPAVPPLLPASPRPLRNAVLAAMLAFFLASLGALIRSAFRRRVSSEHDLEMLGVRLLGKLGRANVRTTPETVLRLLRGSSVGARSLLYANLSLLLGSSHSRALLISSALPSEGKSVVSAALAVSFATSGRRTLLVDINRYHPQQSSLWSSLATTLRLSPQTMNPQAISAQTQAVTAQARGSQPGSAQPGSAQPGSSQAAAGAVSGRGTASLSSDTARDWSELPVLTLRQNLDLIAPGAPLADIPGAFDERSLQRALAGWEERYDVVLIDGPPLLAVADAVWVAPMTAGVLLVVEEGKAESRDLRRALEVLELAQAPVLGAVINKADLRGVRELGSYGSPSLAPALSGQK